MIPPETLAMWEELASKATPGEWKLCAHWKADHCGCGEHRGYIWSADEEHVVAQMGCETDAADQTYPNVGQDGMRADARFIAAARTMVPQLIQRVRELEARAKRAEAAAYALADILNSDWIKDAFAQLSFRGWVMTPIQSDQCKAAWKLYEAMQFALYQANQ